MKTGEKEEYSYIHTTTNNLCSVCGGSGMKSITIITEAPYYPPANTDNVSPYYVYGDRAKKKTKYVTCKSCKGSGHIKIEKRIKDKSYLVPIYGKCDNCREFGTIGPHVERDAEIKRIEAKKGFTFLVTFFYLLYIIHTVIIPFYESCLSVLMKHFMT